MSIYIIADLHLSFNEPKPMNIFGENWENHEEKIKKDWLEKVKEDDTVILPGDFSWAMHLKDTLKDFEFLNNLPGRKILLKGNHDYWWTTVTNMQNFLNENNIKDIDFLHNNSFEIEDKIKYIILDAKWQTLNTIKNYTLNEIMRKYVISIDDYYGNKIDSVILLQGRNCDTIKYEYKDSELSKEAKVFNVPKLDILCLTPETDSSNTIRSKINNLIENVK